MSCTAAVEACLTASRRYRAAGGAACRTGSEICWQQPHGVLGGQDSDVSLVEGENVGIGQAAGEFHDRGVGESDLEIAVLRADLPCQADSCAENVASS